MAELLLDFETALTPVASDGFSSTSGGVSRVATGALGTSWKVQIDKAATNDDYGKVVTADLPTWSSTSSFRFGMAINPNATVTDPTGKVLRIFHTSGSADFDLRMRFTNSTTHKVLFIGNGITTTSEYALTESNDWNTVEVHFEYKDTAHLFDVHLIVDGAIKETKSGITYGGSYTRDWRVGAGDEVGGSFDITGVFYIDEVRFNNTGDDLFPVATTAQHRRALLGVGV